MDGLNIREDTERQTVVVESDKRVEKIVISKSDPDSHFFYARYESGKSIPEIPGVYTRAEDCLKAVKMYLNRTKKTENKKQLDLFGPEPAPEDRPQLKTKPVRKKAGPPNPYEKKVESAEATDAENG